MIRAGSRAHGDTIPRSPRCSSCSTRFTNASPSPTALTAWHRLVDPDGPAITFDFLPIEKLGSDRRPLHQDEFAREAADEFENLKAEFEGMVRGISESRHGELCSKIDNQWADVFWKLRGSEKAIDDLFLRYFRFVTDGLGYWTKATYRAAISTARDPYTGSEANLDSYSMRSTCGTERTCANGSRPSSLRLPMSPARSRSSMTSIFFVHAAAPTQTVAASPIATSRCGSSSCSSPSFSIFGMAAPTSRSGSAFSGTWC